MKYFIYISVIFASFLVVPALTEASGSEFNFSLGLNSKEKVEVIKLQQFLINQGYLKFEATGNFLSMTKTAVQAFQKSEGIDTTGFFGPLTRAAANKKIGLVSNINDKPVAFVGVKSVEKSSGILAAVFMSKTRKINWQTNGYPAGVGVDINLIKKQNSDPVTFTFVRQILKDTPNDGTETWVPQNGESGDDLYIEVTCSKTYQFKTGCQIQGEPVKAF